MYLTLGYVVTHGECENYREMWMLLTLGEDLLILSLQNCRSFSMETLSTLSCLSLLPILYALSIENLSKNICQMYALHDNDADIFQKFCHFEEWFRVESFSEWVVKHPMLIPWLERMIVDDKIPWEHLEGIIIEAETTQESAYLELFTRRRLINKKPILVQIRGRVNKILHSFLD
jgi:hypothetical protein